MAGLLPKVWNHLGPRAGEPKISSSSALIEICILSQMWNVVNKFDFETTRRLRMSNKFFVLDGNGLEKTKTFEACKAALGKRRLIMTYLPIRLLPGNLLDTCKLVYLARNPKDVAVANFHHHRIAR